MVDQLNAFAGEVSRVAREVGTEGKLGGQAAVRGVAGTWKDLTDNVNSMANNLTGQVRNIAEVTIAVANGDLSKKITVDVRGEILELKETINTMVDQLRSFAAEVSRVAREVGTDGKLGGQAQVPGVAGTWKDLTDNVNSMASNLTGQVRNIADVATAIARGDLCRKITVDVKGEILQLKETINTMVDQLSAFASEVTRVAREVGTEGKLGGQAAVPGVAGTWKDLTDNVNSMASNLTGQVRNIADVTIAVANGDLSKKITVDVRGEILQLKETINTMVEQLRSFASEVTRVAREVGTEGRLGVQAVVPGVAGTWKDLTDSVNTMGANLTAQVRNIAEVTTAVARGDLNRKITVDVKGEILELKNTINTMVDQLNSFAGEVTRVAREVGTEGKLGGQAQVPGVGGTWKDLTDNVNFMASNLTEQVRGIVKVVTAVANGNLTPAPHGAGQGRGRGAGRHHQQHDRHARDLRRPGDQRGARSRRRRAARRPGQRARRRRHLEGPHRQRQPAGRQPHHAGARHRRSRHRRDQGRPDALDPGRDPRRSGRAEGQHQHDDLEPARDHREQPRAGLAEDQPRQVHRHAAGPARAEHRGPDAAHRAGAAGATPSRARSTTSTGADDDAAAQAALELRAQRRAGSPRRIRLGEGLVGQCAVEKKRILLTDVPPDFITHRVQPRRGAAASASSCCPCCSKARPRRSSSWPRCSPSPPVNLTFLDQLTQSIGAVFNTIEATMRTEGLLTQSQQLTVELQSRQSELQQTNEELGTKAQAAGRAERRGRAQERRGRAGAPRARGKGRRAGAHLEVQVRVPGQHVARAAHAAQLDPDPQPAARRELAPATSRRSRSSSRATSTRRAPTCSTSSTTSSTSRRSSRARSRSRSRRSRSPACATTSTATSGTWPRPRTCRSTCTSPTDLPRSMDSDPKRLQQILKNLLSNAVKFTAHGHVDVRVGLATQGWSPDHPVLSKAQQVVAFAVEDTGIGVAPEKQRLIFEAFQQADAGTSRKYGGTGLGLAISRELAVLLGGEIKLASVPRAGQHLHPLPAAALRRARQRAQRRAAGVAAAPMARGRSRPAGRARRAHRGRPRRDRGRRPGPADHRGRPALRAHPARPGARQGLQGHRRHQGRAWACRWPGSSSPSAISLDIFLPDMLGWTVLNQLKLDPATRHIPVQIVTLEEERQHGLAHGAFSYLVKEPTTDGLEAAFDRIKDFTAPRTKRLLVVEDNDIERQSIVELLGYDDIEMVTAATGDEALEAMRDQPFDCVVLDLRLPDMTGFELLEKMHAEPALADVPVVVFTGKDLTADEQTQLKTMAKSIVLKDVQSPERLLDETALFLHRVVTDLPPEKQAMLERLHGSQRSPARPQGAGGRRRRAQHLRADLAAREPGHGGDQRDQRPPGHRDHPEHARPEHGADGHHDAGHGRLRDDARDPQRSRVPHACRSWR